MWLDSHNKFYLLKLYCDSNIFRRKKELIEIMCSLVKHLSLPLPLSLIASLSLSLFLSASWWAYFPIAIVNQSTKTKTKHAAELSVVVNLIFKWLNRTKRVKATILNSQIRFIYFSVRVCVWVCEKISMNLFHFNWVD